LRDQIILGSLSLKEKKNTQYFLTKIYLFNFIFSSKRKDNKEDEKLASNTKILLIGGAGYIGSHVSKQLQDQGFDVFIYDCLRTHHQDSKIWGTLIQGDILNPDLLDKTFGTIRPHIVIHLASYIDIKQSIIDPEKYYNNNLTGSINVLNAVKKWHVKYLVFSSSCAVYGSNHIKKNKESDLLNPLSPYAKIKLAIENMINDYASAYGFNFLNLRYFNVAGLDEAVRFKRSEQSHLGLIPLALKQNKAPLLIFGHDFPTQDKTAICDYVHIKDVAFAHFLACRYLLDGKASQTLNVGSGVGHSVLEVIEACEKLKRQSISYVFDQPKNGASFYSVADLTRTRSALGYHPKYSDLENIILSEIDK
jgi:UDP-glucose 4-epimerase